MVTRVPMFDAVDDAKEIINDMAMMEDNPIDEAAATFEAEVADGIVKLHEDTGMTATYSPEDNKLRLYSMGRLDKELYTRVRAAGFIWAPKQELFVAPMWTPGRADLLMELCGEIGDEDTSLVDRQEQRAERFADYSDSRQEDAERAHKAVAAIADNIPLGQPILVGHHSEKHARKDAERIENGMRKAINMWETAKYWKSRAAGALHHAKYKAQPGVRARRIKGLEADLRREQRSKEAASDLLCSWNYPGLTYERALRIANTSAVHIYRQFTLAEYPRSPEATSNYEGDMGIWSALDHKIITAEQAKAIVIPSLESQVGRADRWIAHISNRLEYEKALLEEAGASDLLKPKPRSAKAQLPICNYRAPEGLEIQNIYYQNKMIHHPMIEMTQAEYARINKDYKATRVVGNSHRVRTAMRDHSLVYCFLTDAKVHTPPDKIEKKPAPEFISDAFEDSVKSYVGQQYKEPKSDKFDAMKEQLKAGVKVVSAPQLFPTPAEIADRMVDLADIQHAHRVLEPSAGTGAIYDAIIRNSSYPPNNIVLVEINYALAEALERKVGHQVNCGDFLECKELGEFDRILMNPPFVNGADIKHIKHALTMLKPDGKLVAICANGPRQNEQLMPLADTWEPLPAGSFKDSGTNVNTVLMTVTA